MSDISMSTTNFAKRQTVSRARGVESRQTSLNRRLFWCLVALVALVPLPLASARPFFWALAAISVGVVGLVYTLSLMRLSEDFRFAPVAGALPAAGFGLFCLALVLQTLPIGGLIGGFSVVDSTWLDLRSNQISITPGMTLLMLMRQLTYGLFLFLMLQVLANGTRRIRLLDALLVIIVAYGAYGLISLQSGDTILGMPKWAYLGSATGTFVNRNSFATFLSVGATIAAVRFAGILVQRSMQHADDGRIKGMTSSLMLFGLAFVFLGLVVIATQSRMGLFAGAVGSAVGFCLLLAKARGRMRLAAFAAGGAILLGAVIFATAGDGILDRVVMLETDGLVRGNFYAQIIELIAQRPAIGWGGGSFEQAFQLVHRPPVNVDMTWSLGHNTYLTLWAEMGVFIGSIPILIVSALAVLMVRRFSVRSTNADEIVPLAASLAAITVVAVHSLADFSLEIPANTFLFLAALAGGVSALAKSKRGY